MDDLREKILFPCKRKEKPPEIHTDRSLSLAIIDTRVLLTSGNREENVDGVQNGRRKTSLKKKITEKKGREKYLR